MKYVCIRCCSEFDKWISRGLMKGCPNCGCNTFRRVGSASDDPEIQERLAKEYEALKKDLWG